MRKPKVKPSERIARRAALSANRARGVVSSAVVFLDDRRMGRVNLQAVFSAAPQPR